ncbi:MAG: hypothetical protein HRF51_10080 [bacterium]|jgi:rubrerythrin
MKTKEIQEQLVSNLKKWQKIENASVVSTSKVLEKTENPLLRMVMEIIQQDSQIHYRVQELIVASLESKAVTLTPDELAEIWKLIDNHIELEKKTVEFAEESLSALKGKKMLVQEYFLNYLLEDENKHNNLLASLEKFKKGIYPYA